MDPALNIHVFIGHHKTGSTSIQRCLAVHHQEFIKQGFLYPFADVSSVLCAKCSSYWQAPGPVTGLKARINALASSKNFLEPHNGLAFLMLKEATGSDMPQWHKGLPATSDEIFTLIAEQVADSGAHSLLIASEVLSNFGAAGPELVQKLMNGLPGGEMKLYTILRRPDEYLHSWYRQELCFGYPRMGSLFDRLRNCYLASIHFDYRLMLGAWLEGHAFSQQTLCNYRDVRACGGSVNWFLQAVGASELIQDLQRNGDWANPSLHPAFVDLVRRGNTHLPGRQALDLIRLLKTLGGSDGLPQARDVELLGAPGRRLLVERFEPINRYLGELVNRSFFFPDAEEMLLERPIPLRAAEADTASVVMDRLRDQLSPLQLELVESWAAAVGVTRLR